MSVQACGAGAALVVDVHNPLTKHDGAMFMTTIPEKETMVESNIFFPIAPLLLGLVLRKLLRKWVVLWVGAVCAIVDTFKDFHQLF